MKLKVNKNTLMEDTLGDIANNMGQTAAEETQKALKNLPTSDSLTIVASDDLQQLEGDIEKKLDKSLRRARQVQRQLEADAKWREDKIAAGEPEDKLPSLDPDHYGFAQNILVVGPAGTGKTARIKAWCKDRKINMVAKDAKTMDPSDLGGIISRLVDENGEQTNRATKLTNSEFDELINTPDSILFLDELNRASKEVAGSLLTLIQDHAVVDHEVKGGMKLLSGLLFTVAAVNPAGEEDEEQDYGTNELDMAMKSRFGTTATQYDNLMQLKYLESRYMDAVNNPYNSYEDRLENRGRYNIASALLRDPRFHFDSKEEEAELAHTDYSALNYRSLTNLLNYCDGTKEDFLALWKDFCNPHKYEMVEDILDDYYDFDPDLEDIDDEANAALFDNPYQQQKTVFDTVQSFIGSN